MSRYALLACAATIAFVCPAGLHAADASKHCAIPTDAMRAQVAAATASYEDAEPPLWDNLGSATYPITHEEPAGPGLLRPGPQALLRLQPRRGAARLPHGAEARSDLRPLLLGRGARARSQHQRADDAGGTSAGAGRAEAGPGARRRRQREGARADRGAGEALFRNSAGRSRAARRRLCRRHGRPLRRLSRRSRYRRPRRRGGDGYPALGLLAAGRARPQGPGRRCDQAHRRHLGQGSAARRRDPSLHPSRGSLGPARTRREIRRHPGGADAGRRAHRPHAQPHLLSHRPLRRFADV